MIDGRTLAAEQRRSAVLAGIDARMAAAAAETPLRSWRVHCVLCDFTLYVDLADDDRLAKIQKVARCGQCRCSGLEWEVLRETVSRTGMPSARTPTARTRWPEVVW